MVASERSATTRAATSASRAIDAAKRLTRLIDDHWTESLVLQREIMPLLPEAFERFKAICTAVQEMYIYCIALVMLRCHQGGRNGRAW